MSPSKQKTQGNTGVGESAQWNYKAQAAFNFGIAGWEYRPFRLEDCLMVLHETIPTNLFLAIQQTQLEIQERLGQGDYYFGVAAALGKLRGQTYFVFDEAHPYNKWFDLGDALGSLHHRFIYPQFYESPPDTRRIRNSIRALSPEHVQRIPALQLLPHLKSKHLTSEGFLEWWQSNRHEIVGSAPHPPRSWWNEPFQGLVKAISDGILLHVPWEAQPLRGAIQIPSEFRSAPMSYRKAATLMGKKDSRKSAEWLSKSVEDGSIVCERISRQSHVFDKRQFLISQPKK
jgi:hypothetical protein